jgi:proline iminopeptidase
MSLFPEIEPHFARHLPVGDGHELYVEECGDPHGIPVVVLHGGPGAGAGPHMRRYFDPERWRIILFDQRGTGRSRSADPLAANTADHLVADMEAIRQYFNIDRWLLWGGSWGATLALLYAQTYPAQTLGLVLRGAFLGRVRDLDWLLRDGASRIFPEAWAAFTGALPEKERHDPVAGYHRRLVEAPDEHLDTWAQRWNAWESACSTLVPGEPGGAVHPAMARIECHYFYHRNFMADNVLLEHLDRICHLPAILVHGRYDMVCPLEQSRLLHEQWRSADLRVVEQAGHSAREPGIESALVNAARDMEARL